MEFEFAIDGSGCGVEVFGSGREFRNGLRKRPVGVR